MTRRRRPYRPWARAFTTGMYAALLVYALCMFACAGNVWMGGGALNA